MSNKSSTRKPPIPTRLCRSGKIRCCRELGAVWAVTNGVNYSGWFIRLQCCHGSAGAIAGLQCVEPGKVRRGRRLGIFVAAVGCLVCLCPALSLYHAFETFPLG